jgi:hypothetical protein
MATRKELEQLFQERRIDFVDPGFYDGTAFQLCERQDPRFLENYGEYVHVRSFDCEYLNRARAVVLELATFLVGELVADGRTGACIDVSGALMRMLEHEGIWSCMVAGAATVFFPPDSGLGRRYFSPLVHPNNPAKTGHTWLFAPPFKVVDITLLMQGWNRRESEHIPSAILTERWEPAQADTDDLMEDELAELIQRETGEAPTMANLSPELVQTMKKFPPFLIIIKGTQIKYVPTQVSAMDGTLERMRNLRLSGRYPFELYQQFLEKRATRAVDSPEG